MLMKMGIILGLLLGGSVFAETWSNWRGDGSGGSAPEADPPARPSLESNLTWKVELPGVGCSTPIVWKDRIFLTAEIDGNDGVMVFDSRGQELWRRSFGQGAGVRHKQAGSGSNPSALTDGNQLFVYYKSGTLAALDLNGEVRWTRNLQVDYGPDGLKWDLGTSPIFAGGHLVVAMIHADHPSYLLAFDKKDGKEVWKTLREFEAPGQSQDAYTTPWVADVDGVETIVTFGSDCLTGHRAADGKELWSHRDFNPKQAPNWRAVASAVHAGEVAVVPFGRGDYLAGVKLGGKGETTSSHRLWTLRKTGSDSATPALAGGKIYNLNDRGPRRGTVTCLDPDDGEIAWKTRLPRSAAVYYASPLVAGGRLYAGRADGTLFTAAIEDEGLGEVSECRLEDTLVASPIAVGRRLLVRTHGFLWCFEES